MDYCGVDLEAHEEQRRVSPRETRHNLKEEKTSKSNRDMCALALLKGVFAFFLLLQKESRKESEAFAKLIKVMLSGNKSQTYTQEHTLYSTAKGFLNF